MRRKRMRSGSLRSLRNGVIQRVKTRKRSVQSPVACCKYSTGFAPRSLLMMRQTRSANGIRQIKKTATLVHLLTRSARTRNVTLMVFLLIHSVVHAGDLIAVAVEHEGGAREDFAEAALLGLAPARMVDIGIDVGIETVFRG